MNQDNNVARRTPLNIMGQLIFMSRWLQAPL